MKRVGYASVREAKMEADRMAQSSQSIAYRELSVAERILLVQEIWDSIVPEESSLGVTPAQREELDRRWADYLANPNQGDTWENVKSRIHPCQAKSPAFTLGR
jgi:putative addiction module component (TIGR02574 family)